MRKRGRRIRHSARDATAFVRLIANRSTLPDGHLMNVGLAYHMALEALRQGRATDMDMNHLALALNMAMALCELGHGADELSRVHEAQDALVRCEPYSRTVGHWIVNGDTYKLLCDVLGLHDQQLAQATQKEIREACKYVNRQRDAGNVIRLEEVAGHDREAGIERGSAV
ncbi:TPA: hypothetical protein QDA91_004403 [Burkholderia vietnamiensis]|uniref:hypothetical protein n=1 Tax=Burkholderia vietnamiensis TaxID=60552 RepID=UPI000AFA1F30|nr:hypothetical protein [Burkholderia vietnamiensis]HDR9133258.1 hypothetical protein [Burkholderia vietnamiensis]